VQGTAINSAGSGGAFNGYSAPANSGLDGSAGLRVLGGNGDPFLGFGADGIDATGGSGFFPGTGISASGVTQTGGNDGTGGIFGGGSSSSSGTGDGVDVSAGSGYAGNFNGNVMISGSISAATKNFKIDHPLDPANKYLVHASVESSEMMNIYTGNVVTDAQGEASVSLPEWFETLNTDFRYQLTVIGQFAQAIVRRKIENHHFQIKTSAPNVEVSWQITGVRQDAYAKAHPLVVEEEKDAKLKGFYIHPELYGAPDEKQIEWARHPQMMKQIKERRGKNADRARMADGPKIALPVKMVASKP
jgi:hypothetical protein